MIHLFRRSDGAPVVIMICDFCGKHDGRFGAGHESNREAVERTLDVTLFAHAGHGCHACGPLCGAALRKMKGTSFRIGLPPARGFA